MALKHRSHLATKCRRPSLVHRLNASFPNEDETGGAHVVRSLPYCKANEPTNRRPLTMHDSSHIYAYVHRLSPLRPTGCYLFPLTLSVTPKADVPRSKAELDKVCAVGSLVRTT